MSLVNISWRPDARTLRRFGVVVIVGFCLIGLFFQFWAGERTVALFAYGAAAVLGIPALTGTIIGLPGYWLWMGVGFVMGNIVGRVLLSVLYYGVITPIGVVRRQIVDKLQLRRYPKESYWVDIDSEGERSRYERQF
jgi:hypothetical protein